MENKVSINIIEFFGELVKRTIEKMMIEERQIYLEDHPDTKGNGYYGRVLKTIMGELEDLQVPRTRDGQYRSSILPERRNQSVELRELIQALIVSGVSSRKIVEVLKRVCGTSLSHSSISRIGEVAAEEISNWRNRELESEHAVVFLDATYFPLKRDTVEKEAIYIASAIKPGGYREILGYWIPGGDESALNWAEILEELKQRGLNKIDTIVADGLTGLKGVVQRIFPNSRFQSCVLHMVRNTLRKVRARDRHSIAIDMKSIYQAENLQEAKNNFRLFKDRWAKIYPQRVKSWENNLDDLLTFMRLPKQLWSYVYTTNSLERLMKELKRRLKVMEVLQNQESAEKFLYLLLREANEKYNSRKLKNWEYQYQNFKQKKVRRKLQTQLT